jgi:hypothetical protein
VARAVALFVVVPFLTFASALAPRHVHAAGHDRDHAVAHSHFDPHHVGHESGGLEIEHDDADHGRVVWLDSAVLHESLYQRAPVPPAIPVSYEIVPAEMRWSVTSFDAAAPVHGPPKDSLRFRGPPLPLA